MKRDTWDSDRFEDAVTRTVIALYETALSPDDVGPHWNQVAPAAIGVLRRRGVFIPAPDRLIWDNEIDTALIFGTLKALPAQLPEMVAAHWIENGSAGQMKEAA